MGSLQVILVKCEVSCVIMISSALRYDVCMWIGSHCCISMDAGSMVSRGGGACCASKSTERINLPTLLSLNSRS